MERHFHKVLVANRGEIARRIFRTLRRMGLSTVAVFSDADEDAPHVREADEAVRLGPAPSAESYLNQDAVIRAARAVGAEAIHPGYGFLAENARFAERCAAEGLVFIGPSPEAIRRMADKVEAKALAAAAGVPVLEGFALAGLSAEAIRQRAAEIGYPLLVKAAAGGGGKGMRTVREPPELEDALAAAEREAEGAFGDGSLFIERLLEGPRHVEVQIFGDAAGQVVHLFERDCSAQRRHQKVFEESPSPAVDADLRDRLGAAAVALARAVGYRGAGTVEFLLDASGEFYFLEMNTRLQVEHPVTEAVTGLDLVRFQVEIARGRPLPFAQEELTLRGHAIEARLYAEDPARGFLPAAGRISLFAAPDLPGLRIDSGVEAGQEVGVHYDPMLAKVIAHGDSRDEALRRLHRGLSELAVGGLATNRELLLAVLETEAFRRGEIDTAFLESLPPEARERPAAPEALAAHAVAAALHLFHERRRRPGPTPAGVPPGWRNNRWRPQEQIFEMGSERIEVRYVALGGDHFEMSVVLPVSKIGPHEPPHSDSAASQAEARGDSRTERNPTLSAAKGARLRAKIEGHSEHRPQNPPPSRPLEDGEFFEVGSGPSHSKVRLVEASDFGVDGSVLMIEIAGVRRRFRVGAAGAPGHLTVFGLGRVSELVAVPRFPRREAADTAAGGCAAPMTGKVVEVLVGQGERVEAGAPLVILEAMKMEHRLEARAAGVVASVRVEVGQMVDPDEVLVVVRPEAENVVTEVE